MTEYKVGLFVFFNHLPIIILEGGLIYGATLIGFYQWIWIMITCIILASTIIATSINSSKVYGVSKEALSVRLGKKTIGEYPYSQIRTIRKRKRNIEIGFRNSDKEKVKTIYIGWYIRKYKKMRDQLLEYIEHSDNYERIIFID